jgi:twitching motility protein PilT
MELRALLDGARAAQASDLHLVAGEPPRLRVSGELCPLALPAVSAEALDALLRAILPAQAGAVYVTEFEADFAISVPGCGRFRVNAFQQDRGPGAVFRVIPSAVPELATLGVPPIVRRLADCPRGLVLVTGPTGSGKSTTLAAMVDHRNRSRREHILTIEDPIEFVHTSHASLVNQREVYRHTRSFAAALRAALREDPDVIMVGELRDHETISLALTAAETGHLVLATLHTASAAQTMDRIIDVFPGNQQATARAMLAESLRGVVCQRLIPALAGGRVAVHEVLVGTPAVRNLLREGKVAQLTSTMQTGASVGMQTFAQALLGLERAGLISAASAAGAHPDAAVE